MPWSELTHLVIARYGPALLLRRLIPRERRLEIARIFHALLVFLFTVVLVTMALTTIPAGQVPVLASLASVALPLYGLFLILLSVSFVFSALEAFHRSYYYRNIDPVLTEKETLISPVADWEVATIVHDTDGTDVTTSFIDSAYGTDVLMRAGAPPAFFSEWASARHTPLRADVLTFPRTERLSLSTYAHVLYVNDVSFREHLSRHRVGEEELRGAAQWVHDMVLRKRRAERWWSRDMLGRIPGLAKNWAYGETYLLRRYGYDLTEDGLWAGAILRQRDEEDEVEELEKVLSRSRQANALLLCDDATRARERVLQLYHSIREGKALPPLEGRRIFSVDLERMATMHPEQAQYERTLRSTLTQAQCAGNIVIYLERFPVALARAESAGVSLSDILGPFLESDALTFIATADRAGFHKYIEPSPRLMQAFDELVMKSVDISGVLSLLEQRAEREEVHTGIMFTVPALLAIASLSERYFPGGVMPDKAYDLFAELVPDMFAHGLSVVGRHDVERLVEAKSGIPVGEPSDAERTKLLTLESALEEHVVGQHAATGALARALRRARSGMLSDDKPTASFLFLGPTGVGKTETARALAAVYFGDERNMIRFDMSEFSGVGSLEEMIGSHGEAGRLAKAVQERPYGVFLVDEFEKAHREVHDLFLQILDEGRCTDASGRTVDMRNLIIIATSNAGADMIWKLTAQGQDVATAKEEIIDHLVTSRIFRPELLNRFDDIIVFHPLGKDEAHAIITHELAAVTERVRRSHNVTVECAPELVDALSTLGTESTFGGRPLMRAIHEHVEQTVADRLLSGVLHPGDTLILGPGDVSLTK